MTKVGLRILRQMRHTKGRMFAIAMIVAAAVAIFAGFQNSVAAVIGTRELMASRHEMADYQVYFWAVGRDEVPDLSKLPGVQKVEPRLLLNGTIALPGKPNPLQAKAVLLPVSGQQVLNRIEIVEGRGFTGAHDLDSVIIDKALATYHGFKPGDTLSLTVGSATHEWRIIGISVGPEHLVATANPEFLIPQKGSLGVVYLPAERQADLFGADLINNLSLKVDRNVIDLATFDEKLKPLFTKVEVERFESRDDNFGYAFLKKDIDSISLFVPAIIAVFVVICGFVAFAIFGQILRMQRQEIGTMMALGVTRGRILRSYVWAGACIGLAAGFIGVGMSFGVTAAFNSDYQKGMGLAILLPHHNPVTFAYGMLLAFVTALISVMVPTLFITRLQPIEAVRPQVSSAPVRPPAGIFRWLGRRGIDRVALRNITRDRRRFLLTVFSIAGAIGVALSYRTSSVSVDRTFADYFLTDHWNVIVEYVEPQVTSGVERVKALPEVLTVEQYAKGNVKIVGKTAEKVIQAFGLPYPSQLKDHEATAGRVPSGAPGEVFLFRRLAEQIGVGVGDTVTVIGVEDKRTMQVVGIAAFSPEQIHMSIGDAQVLLKQVGKAAGALVRANDTGDVRLAEAARRLSFVGNVYLKSNIVTALKTHAKELLGIITICIALAMMVACLVILSTAIINLLERESDYAMVRVLGYESRRITRGVLGEIVVTGVLGVILAVPTSFVISSYLNAQVGKAFFHIKTTQEPISILIVTGLTVLLLPFAARPGLRRIREMNLADTVRRKAIG